MEELQTLLQSYQLFTYAFDLHILVLLRDEFGGGDHQIVSHLPVSG